MKKAALAASAAAVVTSEELVPSPNPFASEGFKLSSMTHKCCCVAVRLGDTIDLRDTKNREGPTLSFNKDEWAAFVLGVKNGEFDV